MKIKKTKAGVVSEDGALLVSSSPAGDYGFLGNTRTGYVNVSKLKRPKDGTLEKSDGMSRNVGINIDPSGVTVTTETKDT